MAIGGGHISELLELADDQLFFYTTLFL